MGNLKVRQKHADIQMHKTGRKQQGMK